MRYVIFFLFIVSQISLASAVTFTDMYPSNHLFEVGSTIEIKSTITDADGISSAYVNITYPNATINQISLTDQGSDLYNTSFTTPTLAGEYNITFFANDTLGNTNTTTTNFVNDINDPTNIDGLRSWYDAADNTTLYTDEACTSQVSANGDSVLCWQDKSPNSHNATNVSGKGTPIFSTNVFNGGSVVNFSKAESDTLRHELSSQYTSDFTIFLVIQSKDTSPDTYESFFSNGEPASTDHFQIDYTTSGNSFRYGASAKFNFETFSNEIKLYSVTHNGSFVRLYNEGEEVNNGSTTEGRIFEHYRINQNRNGDRHHDSYIGEIVLYNRTLSACELEQVDVHLGEKYERDFFGIRDNYGYGSPHDNDINGIGEFTSKCSASREFTSAQSSIATISSPTSLDLNDSLTFAHDNGGFSLLSEAPGGYENRINQSWRVDKDNEPGNVSVVFDLSNTEISTLSSDFALLIDTNTNFSDATAHTTGYSVSGSTVTFTTINFSHGDYFSLAVNEKTPSVEFNDPTLADASIHNEDHFTINLTSSAFGDDHYSFVNFDNSLLMWMRFDDTNSSGDPTDASGNGNNGSLQGDALINTTGRFGDAVHFDGNGDFINLPASNSLIENSAAWTMSLWFNAESIDSASLGNRIITLRNESGLSAVAFALGGSDTLQFFYRNQGGTGITTNITAISTNEWYHYAVTYNSSASKVYVNGVLNATISDTIVGTSSHTARIGANPSGGSQFFNGSVDEVLILNHQLPDHEISSLYNATVNQFFGNTTTLSEGNHSFIGYAMSANGKKNQTETRTVTIDTLAPNVTALVPASGSEFNVSNSIEIAANVSDSLGVDTVLANITLPNGTVQQETLANAQGDTYNISFTIPELYGTFQILFIANDTAGNVNSSESSSFMVEEIPLIQFINPTLADSAFYNKSNFIINISSNTSSVDHYTFVDFDNSLVLWMRMDDVNSSGDPTDISSYSNNGTLVGNPVINSTGKFGDGAHFDANGDYIEIPDSSSVKLGPSDFTYALWFRSNIIPSSNRQMLSKRDDNGNYEVQLQPGGSIRTYIGDAGGGGFPTVTTDFNISVDTWYHVLITRGNGNLSMYVNGTLIGQTSSSHNVTTNTNLYIGADGKNQDEHFNGSIDEVLIFNRSFSAAGALSLYNASATQYEHNFTSLSEGNHTFIGYAVGTNGQKNQTETRTVTIDLTNPNGTLMSPTNGTLSNVTSQNLTVNATDNIGLSNATLFVYNASDDLVNQTTTIIGGGVQAVVGTLYNFIDGIFTWFYQIFDLGGNSFTTSNNTITIDTTPPGAVGILPAENTYASLSSSIEIAVNVTDGVGVDSVLANITYPGNSTLMSLTNAVSDKYNASFTLPSVVGRYNITIIANDTVGNINASETGYFVSNFSDPTSVFGAQLWLDATDNTTLYSNTGCTTNITTDNEVVQCIEDKSGNANNATVFTGKSGARYGADTGERINGLTTLRFNKTNGTVYETPIDIRADTTEDISLFAVYRPKTNVTTDQGQALWGNDDGSWDRFYYTLFSYSAGLGTDGVDDGLISLGGASSGLAIDGAGIVDSVFLLTAIYDGNVSGGTNSGPVNASQIYFDGTLTKEFTDESHATAAKTNMFLGWDGDNGGYDGEFAEMIVYDRVVDACEIELINNYLGEKYGKDFGTSSDRYDYSGDFPNDINGIGIFVPSSCVPAPLVDEAASDILTISDPSNVDDNDTLTFGHDNGGLDINTTQIPQGYRRIQQLWRADIDDAGSGHGVGSVNVSFDFSTNTSFLAYDHFVLLVSTTSNMSNASLSGDEGSVTGTTVSFSNITFSDGDYFSIGFNDTTKPNVTSVSATPASTYNLTADITINATVTDAIEVDSVFANITLPNGTIQQLTLPLNSGNTYNATYSVSGLTGTYNVVIIANDTSGNTNDTETTSFEIQNDVPDPSSVEINGGSDITLSSGVNTTVIGSATITDLNGYGDIASVTGYFFLTTFGAEAADNRSNHYTTTCTDNGDGSGNSVSYNCTFNVSHYATPTDSGSNQSATNWTFLIAPLDNQNTGTNGTDVVEMDTLLSFNINPSLIDFGSLNLGANTTTTNEIINITNLGNVGIDLLLSGTNLSCSPGVVPVDFLEYEDNPFGYGIGVDLLESSVELDLDAREGSETDETPIKSTYYGLGIPGTAVGGDCSGTIVLTGQSDPHND